LDHPPTSASADHWNDKKTGVAEWILNTAQIHPNDCMPLQQQFNPIDFTH
jgi:hypothetical protein